MNNTLHYALVIVLVFCLGSLPLNAQTYQETKVEAPFPMPAIKTFVFPDRSFNIRKYGAKSDGKKVNTEAINKTIEVCSKMGGGSVIVPAGTWITGPIHFKSNVNLVLEENAVLSFVDDPKAYLPAVMTTWEGIECYNYSPLIYALECENIAITGKGTLKPQMETWKTWFKRPPAHIEASKQLYAMGATDVPVEKRQMAERENNFRPHLIQFNRCKHVLLDGFKIRESPFWTIHMFMCEDGIVRNMDVYAHGHNNDGIDIEMSKNFLVENCTFDQGDDAVVIKSGRNRDAWRTNMPTENVVIRNCTIVKGHSLLGIGSELSGGVRNIYMTDIKAPSSVLYVVQIKTNHRRGGFVENIYVDGIETENATRIVGIYTDVMYQWRNIVPTYETRYTKIYNINIQNIRSKNTGTIYELRGDSHLPIRLVNLRNIQVENVDKFVSLVENVVDLNTHNITWKSYVPKEKIVPFTDGSVVYKVE